jgi:hypothetical protein
MIFATGDRGYGTMKRTKGGQEVACGVGAKLRMGGGMLRCDGVGEERERGPDGCAASRTLGVCVMMVIGLGIWRIRPAG